MANTCPGGARPSAVNIGLTRRGIERNLRGGFAKVNIVGVSIIRRKDAGRVTLHVDTLRRTLLRRTNLPPPPT